MLSQKTAIRGTGLFWLGLGIWLFIKAIRLSEPNILPLSVLLGLIKGRFILRKTAHRIGLRIALLKPPLSLKVIYPASYLLLIGSMIGLGLAFNFLSFSPSVRGFIDGVIGTALITGSIFYFKMPIPTSLPEKPHLL